MFSSIGTSRSNPSHSGSCTGDGIRGDQEALEALVGKNNHEQIQELPQEYQWLRLSLTKGQDSSTKKVIHWTGPEGKRLIRENMK